LAVLLFGQYGVDATFAQQEAFQLFGCAESAIGGAAVEELDTIDALLSAGQFNLLLLLFLLALLL
jgi:hypothetical protein